MRLAVSLFLALSLAASAGVGATPSLKKVAAEYRALRKIKGHFGGGKWDDAVDASGGRKAQVMAELGARLGDGKHSRKQVVTLMGAPDRIAHDGDILWGLSVPAGASGIDEVLVYYWRGTHDFLWFTVSGKKVLASGWWHAYE